MATIHVTDIQRWLAERGEVDALPGSPDGFFLELRFDDPGRRSGEVDAEFQNKVLTVDCPYGTVTIQFDDEGQLRSLDLS